MNQIITGDAFNHLKNLDAESVHAVITDPPYGLAFMGRSWDDFEPQEYQEWCQDWAELALSVLKPGGHLLAFSGNRTHHRLFTGIEDAGFTIRDTLTWHYGSGFPKALDVSKALDKQAGKADERETLATRTDSDITNGNLATSGAKDTDDIIEYEITAPATDAAKRWEGWRTSLKPATEFIVLARKPFTGTVAENVQRHGTAALNINPCRIAYSDSDLETTRSKNPGRSDTVTSTTYGEDRPQQSVNRDGRYPANVLFDENAASGLDRDVGELAAGHHTGEETAGYGDSREYDGPGSYTGTGGPSRYFYTTKATSAERTLDGKIENDHPTVKPLDLMEWLVQLVTAEGQVVLDPFCGTGTTCRAAKNLGRKFIGIEEQPTWADVARARCGLTPKDPSVLVEDGQATLTGGESV